ncbi:MAG: hypothetical protein F4113_03465 [Rhodothermaceae bacterium]|nr:hypothetical protein [Rhodothermaceae bacterium]
MRLWDVATEQKVRNFARRHAGTALSVAFSPDGKQLASGGGDWNLYLWDVATGQIVRRFAEHLDAIRSVVFSPDGTLLASIGGIDMRLFDVATGQEWYDHFYGHVGARSLVFSPDGTQLASGSADGRCVIMSSMTPRHPIR